MKNVTRGAVEAVPAGFVYREDLISEAEEHELLARIAAVEFAEVRFHGYPAKRSVAHFGVDYEYDSGRVTANGTLPEWLLELCPRAAVVAAVSTSIARIDFAKVNCIGLRSGSSRLSL